MGAVEVFFLLLVVVMPATPNAKSELTESDTNILEFHLNLEYLEAEFFLYGSLGKGLDHFQPNLTGRGPPPVGVRRAHLTPLIRNIVAQFGAQEIGHIRFFSFLLLFLSLYTYYYILKSLMQGNKKQD